MLPNGGIRKNMKIAAKITSKILCAALATTLIAGGAQVFAAERVNEGESATANFTNYDTRVNFSFVPETDGDYCFSSSNSDNDSLDPSIRVYRGSTLVGSAEGDDYQLILYGLEAGKTYQIQARGYGLRGDQEGSYVLSISNVTMPDVAPDFGMPDLQDDWDKDDDQTPDETVSSDTTSENTTSTAPAPAATTDTASTASATTSSEVAARPSAPAVVSGLTDKEALVYGFVERLYTDALGREFDPSGRAYWVSLMLDGNYSGSKVANYFLTSAEFAGRNLNDEQFVRTLYKVFFNRTASVAEVTNWTEALEDGATRSDVINGFTGSSEWSRMCAFYKVNV